MRQRTAREKREADLTSVGRGGPGPAQYPHREQESQREGQRSGGRGKVLKRKAEIRRQRTAATVIPCGQWKAADVRSGSQGQPR